MIKLIMSDMDGTLLDENGRLPKGFADIARQLKEKGVKLIDEKPRRGAGGAMIAFLHPKATGGVLLELCERG